jgi:hypothetical protein
VEESVQLTDVRPRVQLRHSAASLRSWLWPLVIILSSIGVSVVVLGDVHSPVRPLLTFWFLCLCPGMALVRLLDLEEGYIQLTLAIALSLVLDTAVATALLNAHRWSPAHTLALLAGLSLVGVALDVTVVHRGRRTAGRRTAPFQAAFVALPHVARVVPGERLVLALTVQNTRSMAGHYHIDVSGLPAEWFDLATPHVELGPGRRERVELTVHPPAGTVSSPSGYPMTVRMMAEDGLSIEATLIVMSVRAATTARVLVSTCDGLGMEVQPADVVGEEATFSVMFVNRSPAPVVLESVVQAQQNGLRVHVTPHARLLVPPGMAAGPLMVHVVPKRRILRAVPRRYEIALRGRQLGQDALMHPDLVLPARFTYRPREAAPALRRWGRGVALALLSLLLAYVGEQRLAAVLQHALARSSAPRTGVTPQQGPAKPVHGRSIQPPVALRNPTLLSPVALVNPTRLSWGAQSVKTASAPLLIHIVNVGSTPLTMTHVIISGINAREFKARSTCAPRTLGSYDGCTVAVRFTPLAGGTRRATLIITDNAVDSPRQVPLTGHGRTQRT